MKTKAMKYKKPKQGDTVHCWGFGKNYIAHWHMLFLGPDKEAKDKLLVQSKQQGWSIICLSDLPDGSYRPIGRYNLHEEFETKKTKKVTGYTYIFHDKDEPVLITVKLFRGVWRIRSKFEMPSWVKKG